VLRKKLVNKNENNKDASWIKDDEKEHPNSHLRHKYVQQQTMLK
jgi:hypothetical protein